MFKILSIDGGGIKGTLPAACLAHLEETLGGERIADYFDLIVGTSTGGIIALGLGLGLSSKEILSFYEEDGPSIFKRSTWNEKLPKELQRFIQVFRTKYNHAPLEAALKKRFKDKKLGDSQKRLVIPSVIADDGRPHFFKTPHLPIYKTDQNESIVNVAMATSAAPTFFKVHINQDGLPLMDGGLWANNPIMVGLLEAHCILKQPLETIRVLSFGCTKSPLGLKYQNSAHSSWDLTTKLAEVFSITQSESALGMAGLMIGFDNVLRINPLAAAGDYELGDYTKIENLKAKGILEARNNYNKIEELFLQEKAQPYTPCFSPSHL